MGNDLKGLASIFVQEISGKGTIYA